MNTTQPTTSPIGLNPEKSAELTQLLNQLLANYSVFYQNSRGYHWHIKGEQFFELHLKFEELYQNLFVKIDEIAERILTLGGAPEHNFTAYLKKADIPESDKISNGKKAITEILSSLKSLLTLQRSLLDLSGDIGDEGSNALMSDYIREQEKMIWMYSAYLNA